MRLKKNDIVKLNIVNLTNLGFGVGKIDGAVVFVSDAVTGDEVEAKIIKVTSSYAVGRVERYIKRSELRECGRCDLSQCKSCAYRAVTYVEELRIKRESVKAELLKADMGQVEVLPVIPSPKQREYRNKAQYAIGNDGKGGYTIGFFAPKSHRVTEASLCPLASKDFSEILGTLRSFFEENKISVYDEKSGKGLLRHIYLRRAEENGEILLTLVINGKEIPCKDELVKRLTEAHGKIAGILININTESTNVILGDKFVALWGKDYITDTLSGVRLDITAPSFYQVNHDCAELLYKKAKELAKPTKSDTLLDLYCGAGSIGLSMAKDVKELIGIEIVADAVKCAGKNAIQNGIKNARFFTGDAKDTEKLLDIAEGELGRKISPDIIILDPPRAGCAEELVSFVSKLNSKRIIYISCNPATLARDLSRFRQFGYNAESVQPFDMFPMTGHVESVVCLTHTFNN